ncbi:MAG: T9SS type A sorting domain-containing protein [Crocinitomicaceae bacterium]
MPLFVFARFRINLKSIKAISTVPIKNGISVSYSVVDLTGRKVVESSDMSAKHFAIDLLNETSGMYVLEITTHSGRSITRLIKE